MEGLAVRALLDGSCLCGGTFEVGSAVAAATTAARSWGLTNDRRISLQHFCRIPLQHIS